MATVFVPEDRNPWWTDVDGVVRRTQGDDEASNLDVDFGDATGGEVLSSVLISTDGVTTFGNTTTGTTYHCAVYGVGTVTLTAYTTSGVQCVRTFDYVDDDVSRRS